MSEAQQDPIPSLRRAVVAADAAEEGVATDEAGESTRTAIEHLTAAIEAELDARSDEAETGGGSA